METTQAVGKSGLMKEKKTPQPLKITETYLIMHDFETQSPTDKRKVAWRSIIVLALWGVLACIPLIILMSMQHQAERELLAVRDNLANEQQRLAGLEESELLSKDLGTELERLKPKVQKLLSAYSLVKEMPNIDSPLPIIHSQFDNCWWIWVPSGDQSLELYSGISQKNQPTISNDLQNYFSTLMKTATFRMPSAGWYRLRYDVPWATDSTDELKVEFRDYQSNETHSVALGIAKVSGSGGYSSNTELIYWPNQIPTSLVRNTGEPITNSRLAADATPLLQKLSFSSGDQTIYCCIKLKIDLQQSDSASAESPYAGDYQQLERAIIESHRFMR